MPDYTKQLDQIARLLSRPGISPWLLSAFAVFLGIAGGAIGRAIEPWIADFSRRARMRRLLYGDIASMFFHVDTITTFGERWAADRVRDDAFKRLTSVLDFEADGHLNANRDVFTQLDERPAVKHIYHLFHRIVDEGPVNMDNNCGKVQWMLGKYIRDGTLHERYFRKVLPKSQARHLISHATGVYDETIRREQDRQEQNEKHLST